MLSIREMRIQIDEITEGGLNALNQICQRNGWVPEIILKRGTDTTFYTFLATDSDGQITYHSTVEAPQNVSLEFHLDLWLRLQEVKKSTARIREGLVRLDAGLDPEVSSTHTLH